MPTSPSASRARTPPPFGSARSFFSTAASQRTILWTQVDPESGEVSLASALDFETQQEYSFTAVVEDGGFPQGHTASVPLTVLVDDVNDNPPAFPNLAYAARVEEGAGVGAFVHLVAASDPDSAPELSYAILDGDIDPPLFQIGYPLHLPSRESIKQ